MDTTHVMRFGPSSPRQFEMRLLWIPDDEAHAVDYEVDMETLEYRRLDTVMEGE